MKYTMLSIQLLFLILSIIITIIVSYLHNSYSNSYSSYSSNTYIVKSYRNSYYSKENSKKLIFQINAKKPLPKRDLANVEKYLQMRELMSLKNQGASYDELKEASVNGTERFLSKNKYEKTKGYSRFVGKGTLDQRLRNIIAYKRSGNMMNSMDYNSNSASNSGSNSGSAMSKSEEEELYEMMENDDIDNDYDDDSDMDIDDDGEEAEFEVAVMKAIEMNKLKEIKRNMLIEQTLDDDEQQASQNYNSSTELATEDRILSVSLETQIESMLNTTSIDGVLEAKADLAVVDATKNSKKTIDDDELYTPSRSSWGVFQRPKDISKSYGGGRVVTREEMDRIDQEWEEKQKKAQKKEKVYVNALMQKEGENEQTIRNAMSKSRAFLGVGNRKAAVSSLEDIKEFLSWQSDLGGEAWLELGMALETVDRSDDARAIYGKLAASSWSQKIRRQSLALISGLDITKQIRKDVGSRKTSLDPVSMKIVSQALEKGLKTEWTDGKDKYYKNNYQPWYDEKEETEETVTINTLADAYNLLMKQTNPLKNIPSSQLRRAFRKIFLTKREEKVEFMKNKMPLPVAQATVSYVGTVADVEPWIPRSMLIEDSSTTLSASSKQKQPKQLSNTKGIFAIDKTGECVRINNALNGTWDIVVSLVDQQPYNAKKYDLGDVRLVWVIEEATLSESFPVLWGLSSNTISSRVNVDPILWDVKLSGEQLKKSVVPWKRKGQSQQAFEVLYCDEKILITRQVSDIITEPETYILWKRKFPNKWNKF